MNIAAIPTKIFNYFKEVRVEMKKVNWPAREQTARYTLIVIGVCLTVAAFLGGLDYLFTFLRDKFIIK
ncbi:MAG: preprotein translocase subunit SecE [Candidatus Pacebacteria bacterium]|nr:preprotein translocase subunit SecE [Candidatus Paceibacterota bacterium]